MATMEETRQITPGMAHNAVLTWFYAQRPMSARRVVTLEAFHAILRAISPSLPQLGFEPADVQRTLAQAVTDVPTLKVFDTGRLASATEMVPRLADDVLSRARLSRPLVRELQQIAHLVRRPASEIQARLAALPTIAALADLPVVETFASVGMASYAFWTTAPYPAALKMKDDSGVILVDAYGALIGLFYPAPGVASIVLGAAFSIAANEGR
jgi:hypothetical protein